MLINVFQKQKQNVKTRLLGLIDKVGVDYVDDLFRWLKLGSTNDLLSRVVDEVGDDEGRGNKEEGGPGQLFSEYWNNSFNIEIIFSIFKIFSQC